jgi:hypothetical protein
MTLLQSAILKSDQPESAGITRLIETLDSITEGELAISLLVASGPAVIPALRRLLLHGPPKSVYVGRQGAVRALSELNAVSTLIEYLTTTKDIRDATLRYSEEAVENTAAREIGKCKTDEAFQALLGVARQRALPGAVDALGDYRRVEAVPCLIRHLGDDVARIYAEKSLLKIREIALPALIETVRSPEPSVQAEAPGSLRRRQYALTIVAAGECGLGEWASLRFLLFENDPRLAVQAAGIGLQVGAYEDAAGINRILLLGIASGDWSLAALSHQYLSQYLPATRKAIESELSRHETDSSLSARKLTTCLRAILRGGDAI